jgi:protoheme IX farnesyltransferase
MLSRALLGIGLLSSGIATLNQYAERDLDGLMRRTANRPLPAGKLAPWEALAFGAGSRFWPRFICSCSSIR